MRGLRVAVLGTDACATNSVLVSAWRGLGIDAALVHADAIRSWLRDGDTVLGRLDILPTLDGVESGLVELMFLERSGVHVLNTASSLVAAHDKLVTARALARAEVPHPRSGHLTPGGAFPDIGLPVVIKPRLGSWGADVFRCETAEAVRETIAEIRDRPWFRRHGALVQELVPPTGHDLRLVVAGGAVVGAVCRMAACGEWRTNTTLGGSRRRARPSAAASALGVAAAAAIGLDLVGIDLLPVRGGYTVVELNGAVDFDDLYSLPGQHVLQEVAVALGFADAVQPARLRALA